MCVLKSSLEKNDLTSRYATITKRVISNFWNSNSFKNLQSSFQLPFSSITLFYFVTFIGAPSHTMGTSNLNNTKKKNILGFYFRCIYNSVCHVSKNIYLFSSKKFNLKQTFQKTTLLNSLQKA